MTAEDPGRLRLVTPAVRDTVAGHRDRLVARAHQRAGWGDMALRMGAVADEYRDGMGDGYREAAAFWFRRAAEDRADAARHSRHLVEDSPARVGPVLA